MQSNKFHEVVICQVAFDFEINILYVVVLIQELDNNASSLGRRLDLLFIHNFIPFNIMRQFGFHARISFE